MNSKIFSLALAILIVGCTSQQEIRYYRSYNRSPDLTSHLQGKHYEFWYDEKFYAQFMKIEKGSDKWKDVQKAIDGSILDYLFMNSESGLTFMVFRNRYKPSYVRILRESSKYEIIESDQRLVNNTPTLYVRSRDKKEDWLTTSMYCIHYKLGTLTLAFAYPTGSWEEYSEVILKALNGIEVD